MFHLSLDKVLKIVGAVSKTMKDNGVDIHGVSGEDIEKITSIALTKGHDIESAVKQVRGDVVAGVHAVKDAVQQSPSS